MQGRYLFKLLAVDVPSAAGPEQRIYLEGDQRTYDRGAVLREMRDPLLNVSAGLTLALSFLTDYHILRKGLSVNETCLLNTSLV